MKRLTPRGIKYIFSNEIEAVAAYMGSEGIRFFLDLWAKKVWGAFFDKHFNEFVNVLSFDINVTIVHELVHKCADKFVMRNFGVTPQNPEAWEIWEEQVEQCAHELVGGRFGLIPHINVNGDENGNQ